MSKLYMKDSFYRGVIVSTLTLYYLIIIFLYFYLSLESKGEKYFNIVPKNISELMNVVFYLFVTVIPFFLSKLGGFVNIEVNSFNFGYFISSALFIGFVYSTGIALFYIMLATFYRERNSNSSE